MSTLGTDLLAILERRGGARAGHGAAEALVAWANDAVIAGLDSPAMCILAGESPPYYTSEVDDLLRAVLDELRLPEPPDEAAWIDAHLVLLSRDVLRGELDAAEALSHTWYLVGDPLVRGRHQAWRALEAEAIDLAVGRVDGAVVASPAGLAERVREAAHVTLDAMPGWLPPYLALGGDGACDELARGTSYRGRIATASSDTSRLPVGAETSPAEGADVARETKGLRVRELVRRALGWLAGTRRR